ncbi:hypothetical protein BFW38_01640 [Terasakiispira papahanaumokuakeensis]|uniref:Outer membrane protein assembly factor BamE domain-containing protein n=1 Tax=Terasakiispira papahanaumokuakeensis TaxID=197479 RepID=A0A1E2V628_9GAMM|nr:outer membrane protein assembly factor BamE [Terasakiispira papahanaumokuakeensis]ODC02437.1 hypothetical protein BFW38_01640 [Terasakiispira papahanaumokuakeensis]
MLNTLKVVLVAIGFASLVACANVGKPYPEHRVPDIQTGQTTRAEVEQMFGKPWRTGMENGQVTWTYGQYHYGVFSEAETSDLVIRFKPDGTVASYSYNRTGPNNGDPAASSSAP